MMRHNLEWFNHYIWGDPKQFRQSRCETKGRKGRRKLRSRNFPQAPLSKMATAIHARSPRPRKFYASIPALEDVSFGEPGHVLGYLGRNGSAVDDGEYSHRPAPSLAAAASSSKAGRSATS